MKYLFTITLITIGLNVSSAQDVFLNLGRNFTTYDYTNSQLESNPNLESSSGASYELGYNFTSILGNKFDIATSLTLDQYNATGGNLVNNYSWNTNYLGFQTFLKYRLIGKSSISKFAVDINLGVNFNHIIDGEQKINGQTFKLTYRSKSNELACCNYKLH